MVNPAVALTELWRGESRRRSHRAMAWRIPPSLSPSYGVAKKVDNVNCGFFIVNV